MSRPIKDKRKFYFFNTLNTRDRKLMGHLVDKLKFIALYFARYNVCAEEGARQSLQQGTLCIISDLFTFVKHPEYKFNWSL